MDERGTSGDLAEVWIRCECKAERNLGEAALIATQALGNCDGSRHWLGPYTKEPCGEPNRLLIRTASNAYFPQQMSVISLPDRDETVKHAVEAVWDFLEEAEDADGARPRPKRCRYFRLPPQLLSGPSLHAAAWSCRTAMGERRVSDCRLGH
jgi:hypothetical protein